MYSSMACANCSLQARMERCMPRLSDVPLPTMRSSRRCVYAVAESRFAGCFRLKTVTWPEYDAENSDFLEMPF